MKLFFNKWNLQFKKILHYFLDCILFEKMLAVFLIFFCCNVSFLFLKVFTL